MDTLALVAEVSEAERKLKRIEDTVEANGVVLTQIADTLERLREQIDQVLGTMQMLRVGGKAKTRGG